MSYRWLLPLTLLLFLPGCSRKQAEQSSPVIEVRDASAKSSENPESPPVSKRPSSPVVPPPLQPAGSAPPAPYEAGAQAPFQPRPAVSDRPVSSWPSSPAGTTTRTVQIYYSDPLPSSSSYRDGGQFYAILLSNLLGQYSNIQVQRAPLSQYRSENVRNSLRTFYIGTVYGEKLPAAFQKDVLNGAPVTWLGYNVWEIGPDLKKLGLTYKVLHTAKTSLEIGQAYSNVEYKGYHYLKYPGPQEMSEVGAEAAQTQVLATVTNSAGKRLPYLVRHNQFYYFADNPFQYITTTDRYLVLADSLKTMLGDTKTASCRKQAILRFEDLNAMDNPIGISRALNVVQQLKVPFAMTVIPESHYGGMLYPWSHNPGALQQVYRAVDLGGVVVQHGYTHNYHGMLAPEGKTADEWEFWHKQGNRAVPGLTPQKASDRMTAGRQILLKLGLNPQLWTTPHYEADVNLYTAMQKMYPVVLERRMYFADGQRGGQFFPYPVRDVYGTNVLPENLGNVQTNFLPDAILAAADANRNLACPYASVFVHPYLLADNYVGKDKLNEASLKALLQGIQARGFTFVSPLDIKLRTLE